MTKIYINHNCFNKQDGRAFETNTDPSLLAHIMCGFEYMMEDRLNLLDAQDLEPSEQIMLLDSTNQFNIHEIPVTDSMAKKIFEDQGDDKSYFLYALSQGLYTHYGYNGCMFFDESTNTVCIDLFSVREALCSSDDEYQTCIALAKQIITKKTENIFDIICEQRLDFKRKLEKK